MTAVSEAAPAVPAAPAAPAVSPVGPAAPAAPGQGSAAAVCDAAGPGEAVEPGAFRSVMRHHAKGVAVITAGRDAPVGFCATSLSSVSLDPPLVSFTVGLAASAWSTVEREQHAVVHLLAEDQEELARTFARSGAARFGPATHWHRGALGLPVLDGVLAWLAVALVRVIPAGDHALVIGSVVAAGTGSGGGGGAAAPGPAPGASARRAGRPLVHHDGAFGGFAGFTPLEREQGLPLG